MGNALAKRDDDTTVVDGGFVFPTGKVYAKTDCDLRIVKRVRRKPRSTRPCPTLPDSSGPLLS